MKDEKERKSHERGDEQGMQAVRRSMVMEWGMDLLEALIDRTLPLQRCVLCGHREDEVIRRNRKEPPVPVTPRARHRTAVAA